jgi:hypothetical protein
MLRTRCYDGSVHVTAASNRMIEALEHRRHVREYLDDKGMARLDRRQLPHRGRLRATP